jgi:ribosomal protein S18 acetylase RimI-like enzyme
MMDCNLMLQVKRAKSFSQRLTFGYFMFEFFRKSEYGNVLGLGSPPVLSSFAAVPYMLWTAFFGRRSSKYSVLIEGSPVGIIALRPRSDGLYVSSLAVAPCCRGRGIGSFMLRFAEDVAKKAGKKWLALTVMKVNTPAQRLYVKLGFTLKEEKHYSFVLNKRIT